VNVDHLFSVDAPQCFGQDKRSSAAKIGLWCLKLFSGCKSVSPRVEYYTLRCPLLAKPMSHWSRFSEGCETTRWFLYMGQTVKRPN